ncbi:3-oxoacyl-[acyl-carrier-protein] reductase FabG [Paenibacillus larvae subsp. larvae]|uniref:3-oxoacyl-[acyl-carrier-protein] reductase FabG n=1 Tax=Paenibacillus larvae subsp. larvae TaxID=147375 RepID=A0A2L1UEE2_9BACL|nr:2,4-dienoyl-CoA reductase [Paenibacillus larvae]AQZ48518.1 2,4-dienoyl-CoA reductase [Paenibacillus larvae subsp. pulvifaciens]AVF26585.1 3-oxoacyl-[acyl-carrier-protein] reductase FabG [Paenibacillus larvae subsp. larvae]AVF31317.1 3-oxoacyl-[acyl-carrier-protein] reductase FabG [Paenibacillus larvae subsp. larvae]MBH0342193.1 short-chain dehydrogenase [Paenibacillus larvae]MCY7518394.1 2,4-dienoyl-CoA reductase [Paenibacillus larvae]
MRGKTVIITGGSSGMGKAMAKRMAKDGASVVITGRSAEKLGEAREEIETFAGQVLTVQMDVRQPEDVQRMVDEAAASFGRIHALINNAAGNFLCAAEDLSINGWNAVINIVLNGTFYCSQAVGKYWIAEGIPGSIINMVATYAWDAGPGVIHSASAKAGVLAMTRTLAVEWGRRYGIRVNAIAPGLIERTGGADKLIASEEEGKRMLDSVPLGRLGMPEEIAGLAAFLLSDDAAYMNGACLTLDGGQSLNQTFV